MSKNSQLYEMGRKHVRATTIYQDGPYTVAIAQSDLGESVAFAKCNPCDKMDLGRGQEIATRRAIIKLGVKAANC